MNRGYFKCFRKLTDSAIFKNSELTHLWIYLMIEVTHQKINVLFDGEQIELEPGQLLTGRKKISNALEIHESKIQRLLKKLEKYGMINQLTGSFNRVITVCNWSYYQEEEHGSKSKKSSSRVSKQKNKAYSKRSTDIDNRIEIFKNECKEFSDKYPIGHIKSFFEYWSEANSNGKMLFEMQRTWSLSYRLNKWKYTPDQKSDQNKIISIKHKYDEEKSMKNNKDALKRVEANEKKRAQ